MQWQISKNYEIVCVLGLSRGRVVRGYPSKNAGAGIPDLVPGPVLVPAKSARKESNAAFKFPTNPSRARALAVVGMVCQAPLTRLVVLEH